MFMVTKIPPMRHASTHRPYVHEVRDNPAACLAAAERGEEALVTWANCRWPMRLRCMCRASAVATA